MAKRPDEREATFDLQGDLDHLTEDFEVALRDAGWRVTFHADRMGGRADTGSVAAFLLVGIFAGRAPVTLSFDFAPHGDGKVTLHVKRESSGWWLGILGASQATKGFQAALSALRAIYRDTGALL